MNNNINPVEELLDTPVSPVPPAEQSTSENGETVSQVLMNTSQVVGQTQDTPVGTPNIEMVEPAPQPESQPAYTNPQSIMQQPTTIFDNSNQIGQTPPVSLEEEKKPKKKPNKIIFIIVILILLAGIGYGTYYVLNNTDLFVKTEKVSVVAKSLEINVGEELPTNISEYATISGTEELNCYKDITSVDLKKEGTYKFVVTCGKVSSTGSIKVVDNTDFTTLVKAVYKKKGESLEASEFATDSTVNYAFINEEDNKATDNDPGTYTIKLSLSKGDKTAEVEATLVVLSASLKGYLTCTSNNQFTDESSNSPLMNVVKKIGILDDGKNSFAGFINETYTFTFSDSTLFTEYKNKYKENNTLEINNISGRTIFGKDSEGKSTIIITVDKDSEKAKGEYGEENLKDFSTLMKYFAGTGLKCIFSKVE